MLAPHRTHGGSQLLFSRCPKQSQGGFIRENNFASVFCSSLSFLPELCLDTTSPCSSTNSHSGGLLPSTLPLQERKHTVSSDKAGSLVFVCDVVTEMEYDILHGEKQNQNEHSAAQTLLFTFEFPPTSQRVKCKTNLSFFLSQCQMGEFKVHRVRFFDYMPSAIRAMAFNSHTERLAVARADGAVEIFHFADNYFQEKVIPGRDRRAIEALCWVGHRLFSAGLDGEVTEYDLENLRARYSIEAYGGPIWAISSNSQGTLLAAGCEDGTVKMFEILEERIQFQRNLSRQNGRIISLSWHPSGALIAAGMMDMVRIFDTETGHATHRLLVERGVGASKSREVVVWSVAFLSDYTIISGDSVGKVQIWDGLTGTLIRTHLVTKWDVLALSISQDESSVIAGTSEGTVVQFQFISSTVGQQDKHWVRTRTFKNHSHDVRALVHTDTAVVSGGMDTQVVVRPLLDKVEKNTQESALRKIAFPHRSLVSCAKKTGLLLFQFPDHLELWRLGESDGNGTPGESLPVKRKPEKLIQLKMKGEDHICCSTLSPCGSWLAYSTVSSVRLYRLQLSSNNISIQKVSKLPKELRSVHQLCFSSDSSRLFASSSLSSVIVVALDQTECKYLHTLKHKSGECC
ncbi:hypothetical protein XENORESO_007567 [Xenotaenia resolanae]|uniref:Anaphase-promoting complex subunit 4 WD40 domain-containing protein n=1 Tax=Xenotaenia resolanae TaxID=208358 RepID=A0ABV0WC57_9TELE